MDAPAASQSSCSWPFPLLSSLLSCPVPYVSTRPDVCFCHSAGFPAWSGLDLSCVMAVYCRFESAPLQLLPEGGELSALHRPSAAGRPARTERLVRQGSTPRSWKSNLM